MESTTSEETNVENKQEEPVQEGEPEQRKRGYSEVTPGESEPKEEPGQTQNKRQRTEDVGYTLRILIRDNREAGLLIGKGGENISRIRRESGAIITITKSAGRIIGKGGQMIRDISTASGARVQISSDNLPGSTERTLTISGAVAGIVTAVNRVAAILAENKSKEAGTTLYNPSAEGGAPPMGMSPEMMFAGTDPQWRQPFMDQLASFNATSPVATTMTIPDSQVGSVIGQKGRTINDIRQQSGATIKVAAPVQGAVEREITITGTPHATQIAVGMITQVITRSHERRMQMEGHK